MSLHMGEDELLALIKRMQLGESSPEDRTTAGANIQGNEGLIRIENNKIIVQDGSEDRGFPSLEAIFPVQLIKNGVVCTGRVFLEPGDRLDWQVERQELFRIEVSDNKQEAYLQLVSKTRYGWRLKDQPPKAQLIVEAEQDESMVLETLSFTDIMKELQARSIVKNLRTSAIFQELQQLTMGRVLIAQGVEPEPSEDAKLDIYFSEEIKSVLRENDLTKTIDYRNHLQIPSVKKGHLIARKLPARHGVAGYNVYGEMLHPSPPKDITVIAKDHVEIQASGEVFALKDGRPRITGSGSVKYLDIATSFVVSGDVDIRTGNIVFSGDVIVYGNVMEGMIIESLGNVYIFGNVYQSTITATGSITVKGNIIKSNLYSGYYGVIFNRLYVSCKALSEQLNLLVQAAKTLVQMVESKGQIVRIGQVFMVLMESKFKKIPLLASDALHSIQNLQQISEKELEELKEKVVLLTSSHKILSFDSYNHIFAIQNMVEETYQMVERMQEVTANIDIDQGHLSNFKATGDIFIRKEGVLQSNLFCKGNIAFFDKDSVCRGGQMEAHGIISAMVVGGDYGGETIVKAGKRITLHKMTAGRICVGKYWQEIEKPIVNLTAYVQESRLVIEGDGKL